MLPTPLMTLSIATVVAGLALSTPGAAFAQDANASPVAKKNANENAAGAGSNESAAGAGSQAATPAAADLGGPDGHECGGLGHVISQGEGHEDDACGDLGVDATATGSIGGTSTPVGVPETCSTEGLRPLVELFMEEHAAAIREADNAAVAELDGCIDVAGDPEVQSAVADNPALIAALEARGYGVQQVVAADARGDIPTLYVAVPGIE